MAKPNRILFSAIVVALLCSFAATAYAPTFVFELTSNYSNPIPQGATVTITAKTDDTRADTVTFVWYNPASQPVWTDVMSMYQNGGFLYAESTHTPDALGTWTVEATFTGVKMYGRGTCRDYVTIQRQIPLNFIPEVPILGTAGAVVAMALGLAYKKKRKTKNQQQ
jgi:FlaG/FlaF family flagellin (archaellin)